MNKDLTQFRVDLSTGELVQLQSNLAAGGRAMELSELRHQLCSDKDLKRTVLLNRYLYLVICLPYHQGCGSGPFLIIPDPANQNLIIRIRIGTICKYRNAVQKNSNHSDFLRFDFFP